MRPLMFFFFLVKKGATTSHVRVDIGGGNILTSSITNEASMNWASRPRVRLPWW